MLFLLFSSRLKAQEQLISSTIELKDTVKPDYSVGGKLDSADLVIGTFVSSTPFIQQSFWNYSYHTFLQQTQLNALALPQLESARYTTIPLVGFTYSVGSKSTQIGTIRYTQQIKKGNFLQFTYKRFSTAGWMQGSAFDQTKFQLIHTVFKRKYKSRIFIDFLGNKQGLNGGLVGDTLDRNLPIEFQVVKTSSVQQNSNRFYLDWTQKFKLNNDSLRSIGLVFAPNYSISNRRFQETGDLKQFYSVFNLDSTSTNDYFEQTRIGALVGAYFEGQKSTLTAGIRSTFWDYDNRTNHFDTLELRLESEFNYKLSHSKKVHLHGFYGFKGAVGTYQFKGEFVVPISKFGLLSLKTQLKSEFVDLYQRWNTANQYNYNWTQPTVQNLQEVGIDFQTNRFKQLISFNVFRHDNLLLWDGKGWSNINFPEFSQLTMMALKYRSDFSFRSFILQPQLNIQLSDQSNAVSYFPKFQGSCRIGFQGGLFEAKKLKAAIGVDLGYISSYSILSFDRLMGVVHPTINAAYTLKGRPVFHAFGQMQIGNMKWFLRIEQLESIFIQAPNYQLIGYPILDTQLRIGLSWDLFN